MSNLQHFEFVWWWVLLLLPLPLLVIYFAPAANDDNAVYLPFVPQEEGTGSPSRLLSKSLAVVFWISLVIACARPVWYGDPVENQSQHRDVMLVVDLSGSMQREDMEYNGGYIDRLSAVKHVLADFVSKRKGDRIGLVFFADHAYLQTPLTLDRKTVTEQINQTVLGLVGKKTAIGEGIGLATKTFIDTDAPQRVMILLSDGENTAGVMEPVQAARIAKKYATTIYTVGVGAGEMEVSEFFMTRKVDTAKDLDEKTLTQVAEMTGGKYFRAKNQQDLQAIYDTINELEPISKVTETWRPQSEWFPYPLGLALFLSACLILMRKNHG